MPLWDSVQRSLEKASQEAARLARTQRLRSIIDGLLRQINTQNTSIVNKTMELYLAGQLTQSELLPLCQEMINLHQQLNQAQNELKQLQMQAPPPAPGTPGTQGAPGIQAPQASIPPQGMASSGQLPPPVTDAGRQASFATPITEGSQNASIAPPPPGYQSYLDSTNAYTVPPPPPGMEPQTVSSLETFLVNMPPPQTSSRLCTVCHSEVQPTTAFCPNCGTPVQESGSQHLPTMRGGTMEQIYGDAQATQAVSAGSASSGYEKQNTPATDLESNQETVRANASVQIPPPPPNNAAQASEQDKEV